MVWESGFELTGRHIARLAWKKGRNELRKEQKKEIKSRLAIQQASVADLPAPALSSVSYETALSVFKEYCHKYGYGYGDEKNTFGLFCQEQLRALAGR